MKTKLLKPELKLDIDDSIVSFVENYESNEHLTEIKIAVVSDKEKSQYRSITVFGYEALEDLHEELDDWGLTNFLDGFPPTGPYVAIYGYSPDVDDEDDEDELF